MKILFVYWAFEDQGSGLVLQGYTDAARAVGHEVAVYGKWRYGKDNPHIPLNYTLEVESADAIVFIFEWTQEIHPGDQLDLLRLVAKVPRTRRVILDGDGKYNPLLRDETDHNHADEASRNRWVEVCESLTDKICQPTLHPRCENVRPFLFYAYNPAWERDFQMAEHDFDLLYVGHSKFRWTACRRVLDALVPIRDRIGRIALVGHGWREPPPWAARMGLEATYATERDYLDELDVETLPAVHFSTVLDWMSKGAINLVLQRPLFEQLRFVTPRMFETPAAATIPLFVLERELVDEIYGPAAQAMTLAQNGGSRQIVNMLTDPHDFRTQCCEVRAHLTTFHSHAVRFQQLLEIIES